MRVTAKQATSPLRRPLQLFTRTSAGPLPANPGPRLAIRPHNGDLRTLKPDATANYDVKISELSLDFLVGSCARHHNQAAAAERQAHGERWRTGLLALPGHPSDGLASLPVVSSRVVSSPHHQSR